MLGTSDRLRDGKMMEQLQVSYKGKNPDARPTERQLEILKKIGVREDVIERLSRKEAFELLHTLVIQYYEATSSKRLRVGTYVRW